MNAIDALRTVKGFVGRRVDTHGYSEKEYGRYRKDKAEYEEAMRVLEAALTAGKLQP